ncbi:MAG: hypothetical protein OWR52_12580 [Acidibacillus sp.]|nr:hypothetical protein [Acidibacillus sp.]
MSAFEFTIRTIVHDHPDVVVNHIAQLILIEIIPLRNQESKDLESIGSNLVDTSNQ